MIYCVWYPSGGFGHYINAVLSIYGQGFKRPENQLAFSDTGDSHSLNLIAPKYYHDPISYQYNFDPSLNYSVLIDNGINNEGRKFKFFFQEQKLLKYATATFPGQ